MITRPSNVRWAMPVDEDAVYRLLLKLHEDNSIGFSYEEDAVRESIRTGTEKRGGFIAIIDAPDRTGEVAASVGLHFGKFWYSNQNYLFEAWLFVDPVYRKGTGYADDLMNFVSWLKAAMNEAGPELTVFTSVSSRKRLAQKARWWARRGELIGHIFLVK